MAELPFDQKRVLGQIDDVWQLVREVEAGLPYMPHRDVLANLHALKGRGLADCRRSDAHGRWEWAITEKGDALLVELGGRW